MEPSLGQRIVEDTGIRSVTLLSDRGGHRHVSRECEEALAHPTGRREGTILHDHKRTSPLARECCRVFGCSKVLLCFRRYVECKSTQRTELRIKLLQIFNNVFRRELQSHVSLPVIGGGVFLRAVTNGTQAAEMSLPLTSIKLDTSTPSCLTFSIHL